MAGRGRRGEEERDVNERLGVRWMKEDREGDEMSVEEKDGGREGDTEGKDVN